jgi:murein DD-endopeptidase MepM/ murein hydrolase activator NlpD
MQWFSAWRVRRIVLPIATIALAYAAMVLFTPDARQRASASPAVLVPPRPKMAVPAVKILPEHAGIAAISLKAMFSPTPSVTRKTLAVGRGDTLMNLLVRNHIPRDDAYQAIAALARAKVYDPRDLNPSHKITVFFDSPLQQDEAAPTFRGMTIQKDVVSTVRVGRGGDGRFAAEEKDKPVHAEMRAFRGVIDDSLFVSAQNAGVPDGIILDLIKMYSYGVDFQRDIQSGDKFEVMYRAPVTEDGDTVNARGQIVYAKLTLSGKEMPLYYYKDIYGDADYYDAKGQGAKKPLMKTPIDGARLSSGFGMRRHPVLGFTKMHQGVDFAAPRGTPIYAAGDGVIEKMGPFSTYGNYLKIRHRAGLETAYAHMQGFKTGLRRGARVKQGQIVGYVGMTGRATGAHLHYEVIISGRQVNPATVKLAGGKALGGKELKKFKAAIGETDRAFHDSADNKAVASLQQPAPRKQP